MRQATTSTVYIFNSFYRQSILETWWQAQVTYTVKDISSTKFKQEAKRLEHGSNNSKALKVAQIHNSNKYGDIVEREYLVEMFPIEI